MFLRFVVVFLNMLANITNGSTTYVCKLKTTDLNQNRIEYLDCLKVQMVDTTET